MKNAFTQTPESGPEILLTGQSLSLNEIVAVSRHGQKVKISPDCFAKINASRKYVEDLVNNNQIAYGITTGYGPLVNRLIPPEKAAESQYNLIQMLSGGVGEPLAVDVARAITLIRINSLCKGYSGIRHSTLEFMCELLNRGVTPYIPETGSVGASGDLCPLAHMVQALLGEGEVFYKGTIVPARKALEDAKLSPIKLSYKEGLALINGTTVMSGLFALALADAWDIVLLAEALASFATDVLRGNPEHFDLRISKIRQHPGQMTTSKNLLAFGKGSQLTLDGEALRKILKEARKKSDKVLHVNTDLQNPYSIRCVPQIVGAVRDLLTFVDGLLKTEVNSVTDNPLIFAEDLVDLHGGNFYGQHLSFASDILGLGLTKLALLSERRFARYIDDKFSQGLPAFLIKGDEAGFDNGFMGIQLVATALAAEIRNMNDSASVSSIPTNANNQDIVSMGTPAAKKLSIMIEKTRALFAYELLALAQAADFLGPEKLGVAGKALHAEVRSVVPFLTHDRPFRPDIQALVAKMQDRSFMTALNAAVPG